MTTQQRVDRILGLYEHDELWILHSIAMQGQLLQDVEKVETASGEGGIPVSVV